MTDIGFLYFSNYFLNKIFIFWLLWLNVCLFFRLRVITLQNNCNYFYSQKEFNNYTPKIEWSELEIPHKEYNDSAPKTTFPLMSCYFLMQLNDNNVKKERKKNNYLTYCYLSGRDYIIINSHFFILKPCELLHKSETNLLILFF